MRRLFLLYNPASGRRRHIREAHVAAAAEVFRGAGFETLVEPTTGPATATEQVRRALERGCDAVVVAGGDGTVNEAVHGMIGAGAALGVIPFGTGNGLANDLQLPRDPAAAARLLASAPTRQITLSRMDYLGCDGHAGWRYFLIGAGIGADAQMVYRLTLAFKQRWGMAAYYTESTRQWLTHSFPLFTVEFCDQGRIRREQVSQVLGIRIAYFGGLLRFLAPGADLFGSDMRLVLFKTRRRLSYLRYMMGVWLDRPSALPDVEIISATECRCLPSPETSAGKTQPCAPPRIYAEADGELLGTLPVSLSMTSTAIDILVPPVPPRPCPSRM